MVGIQNLLKSDFENQFLNLRDALFKELELESRGAESQPIFLIFEPLDSNSSAQS